MRPDAKPSVLTAQLGASTTPHPTCDARSCQALAHAQMVIELTPSRKDPRVRMPMNFYLCPEHQSDLATAEKVWAMIPELWDHVVECLTPSGKVPVKELSRVDWIPCPPPAAASVVH
jgi:hypothetical protein